MGFDTIITDAVAHFGAGIVVSLLDYTTSRIADSSRGRAERTKQCLAAANAILGTADVGQEEGGGPDARPRPDTVDYALNVEAVKAYLRASGLAKMSLPWPAKVKAFVRGMLHHEKVNTLTSAQKLGVAVAAEICYDSLLGFHYYTRVLEESPVAAISRNLYQVPALFLGLWFGNGVKKVINWFLTSRDERDASRAVRRLLEETDVVTLVLAYEPSAEVLVGLEREGVAPSSHLLTRVGAGAYRRLQSLAEGTKQATDSVLHYSENQARKHLDEGEARRKRFEDLTKGR